MTNVEQANSTSQLNTVKGNGHVGNQSCYGNGDSKIGNIQVKLEQSTFGVILSPTSYGNDGTLCRKTERKKIIVKRKVSSDDSVIELRTESPNNKRKASDPCETDAGEQRLKQLDGTFVKRSLEQELTELEAECEDDEEQLALGRDVSGDIRPPLVQQDSLDPFSQNGDVVLSDEDEYLRGFGFGSFAGTGDTPASSEESESALRPLTSDQSNSSQSNLQSIVSETELNPSAQVLQCEVKDADSSVPEENIGTADSSQLREKSDSDGASDGAKTATGPFEPGSPVHRNDSGGDLELPHTPKAKRTPLFFRPVENATDSSLLSSPSHSNPPVTSSASPAKRSPLPLPTVRSHWPVATPSGTEDLEDVTAGDHDRVFSVDDHDQLLPPGDHDRLISVADRNHVLSADDHDQVISDEEADPSGFTKDSQSREDVEAAEHFPGEESPTGGGKFAAEEEQELQDSDDGAEPGSEDDFEVEASDEIDADLDFEHDDDQTNNGAQHEGVFEEELSGDDDFTAILKKSIPVFGQDRQRSIPTEDLYALDDEDLSYDDYEETQKLDIRTLDQDIPISADLKHGLDAEILAEDAFTRSEPSLGDRKDDLAISIESKDGVDGETLVEDVHTPSEPSLGDLKDDLTSRMPSAPVLRSTRGRPKFSFQGLANGELRDEDGNDTESSSQERELESDQLDETPGHDSAETSTSQVSSDIVDDRGGVSRLRSGRHSGRPRTRGRSGAIKKRPRYEEGGESDSAEDASLSPDEFSPISSMLRRTKPSERPERLGSLESSLRTTRTSRSLKIEVKEEEPLQSKARVKRLKIKMSSEVHVKKEVVSIPARTLSIKEAPVTAKALLATGILAGHHVRYMDRHRNVMLTGWINDTGIICDCRECKGKTTVNVSAFEKHAGSSARHPSDFIYLDNDKNLHDVMEAGWRASENGKKVSLALHMAMQLEPQKPNTKSCAECGSGDTNLTCSGEHCSKGYHLECAGLSTPPDGDWLCSHCGSLAENQRRPPKINSSLVRETSTSKDSNANMHKALFTPGGLPDSTEVGYYVKGQKFLTGEKMGVGILCSCCSQVVSCSQFEQHAGWGSRRNPYSSIYLEDGRSLHIAALDLGQNQGDKTPVENVDYCTECGDGGELVLCDSCPGAYHPECAGLISIPAGNWFCPPCKNRNNAYSGSGRKRTNKMKLKSKAGGGSKYDIDDRCTWLLKATDTVSSGCVFCRSGEFEKVGFGPRTILLCDQCEREYHVGCLKEQGLANLEALPEGEWFCGKDCEHIHSILHLLVSNGMEPLADSIISQSLQGKQRQSITEPAEDPQTISFSWQLLHGRRGDPQNGKTLSQAAAIFSEMFDPIVDESSGRDLIPVMVYSRNIRDQDFAGMHCVVLKRNDEVVTAALVRIFGRQFAELPLVATKAGSTGQGFCRALILSVERLLGVLHVQRLVLPAAADAEGIWVKSFNFQRLSDEESRKYRSEVQMMIFKGSSLLQKSISPLAIK